MNRALDQARLDGSTVVARASGHKKGDRRWTVLTIYKPAGDGQYVAEIVGETLIPGEERRQRRAAFPTLAKALNWSAFDFSSKLYEQLRNDAVRSFDRPPAVFATPMEQTEARARELMSSRPGLVVAATNEPFNGDTLRDAIMWLYGPVTEHEGEAVALFVQDWGIDNREDWEGGCILEAHVFEVMDREEQLGRPPWAETFVRAMRHFRRESFHASRDR